MEATKSTNPPALNNLTIIQDAMFKFPKGKRDITRVDGKISKQNKAQLKAFARKAYGVASKDYTNNLISLARKNKGGIRKNMKLETQERYALNYILKNYNKELQVSRTTEQTEKKQKKKIVKPKPQQKKFGKEIICEIKYAVKTWTLNAKDQKKIRMRLTPEQIKKLPLNRFNYKDTIELPLSDNQGVFLTSQGKYKDEAIRKVSNFEKAISEESGVDKITPVAEMKLTTYSVRNGKKFRKIKLREAGKLNLDGMLPNHIWCKDKGTCFPDWIEYRYGKVNNFKKISTLEAVQKWSCYFEDDGDLEFDVCLLPEIEEGVDIQQQQTEAENPNEYGYTIDHIKNWCCKARVNMYALYDGVLEYEYKPQNSLHYPLVFESRNNHFYPIIDTRKIKSITNKGNKTISSDTDITYDDKDETPDVVKEAPEVVEFDPMDDKETSYQYLIRMCEENKTMVFPSNNLVMTKGKLTAFNLCEKKYLCNGSCPLIKEYCENNNINYVGQSYSTFAFKMINDHFTLSSYFNEGVGRLFFQKAVKHKQHYGLVCDEEILQDETKQMVAWDIKKCYRACMEKPYDDWATIQFYHNIHIFTPDEVRDLKAFGFFYVETDDYTLLNGTNIYTHNMVLKACVEEIITTAQIKAFIPAKREGKKAFNELIKHTADAFTDTQLVKNIINSFSGIMGRTQNKNIHLKVDDDNSRVWNDYLKLKGISGSGNLFLKREEYSNGKEVWLYGEKSTHDLCSHNLPIYLQILDWSNIRLYDMIKAMKSLGRNAQLVWRKTDCAVVAYDKVNEAITLIDEAPYRKWEETISYHLGVKEKDYRADVKKLNAQRLHAPQMEQMRFEKSMDKMLHDNGEEIGGWDDHCLPTRWGQMNTINFMGLKTQPEWEELPYHNSDDYEKIYQAFKTNGGGMLLGRAGTGKTYAINKMDCLTQDGLINIKLAFTNKATINLDGETIHKFLKITEDGKVCKKWARIACKNVDFIKIDEISMVSCELWKHLTELKKLTGCAFILIGDFRQLPPVDTNPHTQNIDWFNHPNVMYLANNLKCELTEMKRYDKMLWNFLEDVYERTPDFTGMKYGEPLTDELISTLNLTYTNDKRREINKKVNEYLADENGKENCVYLEYKPKEEKMVDEILDETIDDDELEQLISKILCEDCGKKIEKKCEDSKKYKQSAYLYPSCKLYMNITTKEKTFKKNEMVWITDMEDNCFTITNGKDEEEFSYGKYHETFLLGYASTTHKAQGDTENGVINIFEVEKMRRDKRLLYTACSRGTKKENIHLICS